MKKTIIFGEQEFHFNSKSTPKRFEFTKRYENEGITEYELTVDMGEDNQALSMKWSRHMILVERGLGDLLAIEKYEFYDNYNNIHAYEQVAGDELINDIPGYRASAFARLGHYIAITYKEQPCIKGI